MTFKYNEIWSLVSEIQKMPYGSGFCVPRHVWEDIVPMPDPLSQMFLALAGHRPETERTPEDWFRFWLNGPSEARPLFRDRHGEELCVPARR